MSEEVFAFTHPLWLWLAAGGLLLLGEIVTGSSWLLWPAVCAGFMGVLAALGVDMSVAEQLALWAGLSVATTLASRRLFRRERGEADGDDVNAVRLLGRSGRAVTAFEGGRGRVLVDGAEWTAELDGADALPSGARVEVTGQLDAARLRVRPLG